jgi:hypothetical protein
MSARYRLGAAESHNAAAAFFFGFSHVTGYIELAVKVFPGIQEIFYDSFIHDL